MRARRNSTDAELQRLRRELHASPGDDGVRAALVNGLMRAGRWREVADLAAKADRQNRGLTITVISVAAGRDHTSYEIEHVRDERAEAHDVAADRVLNGIVAAVAAWGREPLGVSTWLLPTDEARHKEEVRERGLYWHEILGLSWLRPVLERAGLRVVGEVSSDATVIGMHNPFADPATARAVRRGGAR